MSKKSAPRGDEDTIDYIGPVLHEPAPIAVKPFIAPPTENAPVPMSDAVAPPLSWYEVSLEKQRFPQLKKNVQAADPVDAKKKFYDKYHITHCQIDPEIRLLNDAEAAAAAEELQAEKRLLESQLEASRRELVGDSLRKIV